MVFRHPDTSTSLPPWNSPHNPVKPEMRSGDMGPSLSVPRPVLNASLHCNWQACTSSLADGRFTVKSAELRLQPVGNSLDMAICDHSEQKRGQGLYRRWCKDYSRQLQSHGWNNAVATSMQPHIFMFQRLTTLTGSNLMMTAVVLLSL